MKRAFLAVAACLLTATLSVAADALVMTTKDFKMECHPSPEVHKVGNVDVELWCRGTSASNIILWVTKAPGTATAQEISFFAVNGVGVGDKDVDAIGKLDDPAFAGLSKTEQPVHVAGAFVSEQVPHEPLKNYGGGSVDAYYLPVQIGGKTLQLAVLVTKAPDGGFLVGTLIDSKSSDAAGIVKAARSLAKDFASN
jgi:hypothetical protein